VPAASPRQGVHPLPEKDRRGRSKASRRARDIERLFAEITRQQIRRGVFKSVAELEAAIETWLTERNAKPKPFKWTAKANIILEKNARGRRALEEAVSAGIK
jgi:hypothetical protein